MSSPNIDIKEARKKFDELMKDCLSEYSKVYPNFGGFFPLSYYKQFYSKYGITMPKSIKLVTSNETKKIIEGVKSSKLDPIFKRFISKNDLIKSTYLNDSNINEIEYREGKFYAFTYSILDKALFKSYLETRDIQRIVHITMYTDGSINLTIRDSKGTLRNSNRIIVEPIELTPTKLLTSLFDIVRPHQAELMGAYCAIYENEKKKLLNNFCIVRGELIRHYYDGQNYVKTNSEASTLHKSCMRKSPEVSFYSLFPNNVGMLVLLDKNGKLKGRALVWEGQELNNSSPDNIAVNLKNSKQTIIDRIYYDCDDTYNLFISYVKSKGWKSSYSQRGLEKIYCAVKLDPPKNNSILKYLKYIDKLPYLDSFTGSTVIDNSNLLLHNCFGGGWGSFTESLHKVYNFNVLRDILNRYKDSYSIVGNAVLKEWKNNNIIQFKLDSEIITIDLNIFEKTVFEGINDASGLILKIYEIFFHRLKSMGIISTNKYLSSSTEQEAKKSTLYSEMSEVSIANYVYDIGMRDIYRTFGISAFPSSEPVISNKVLHKEEFKPIDSIRRYTDRISEIHDAIEGWMIVSDTTSKIKYKITIDVIRLFFSVFERHVSAEEFGIISRILYNSLLILRSKAKKYNIANGSIQRILKSLLYKKKSPLAYYSEKDNNRTEVENYIDKIVIKNNKGMLQLKPLEPVVDTCFTSFLRGRNSIFTTDIQKALKYCTEEYLSSLIGNDAIEDINVYFHLSGNATPWIKIYLTTVIEGKEIALMGSNSITGPVDHIIGDNIRKTKEGDYKICADDKEYQDTSSLTVEEKAYLIVTYLKEHYKLIIN